MKRLTNAEMQKVLGGVGIEEPTLKTCEDVKKEGAEHEGDSSFNWEKWADEYDELCGAIILYPRP